MELQLLRADGSPAADALVSLSDAPVPMPDLAAVADAAGRVSLELPPLPGRFVFNVWLDGRSHELPCHLATPVDRLVLRLPG
ncbi:hypothetical protein G8A07_15060 [Roseateles sp. DAIF2]|uniref:hypothetical protein n=1 Tax=Roseateles sp. DAIF2 TaxID=2714952 RepID=UPI0018A2C7D5|nr:hypothetical protein [Roseateles sp. DAIF2]QPF74100.1 hypothetical protein G8A07_15060 [Roseateles sp. DAIF2]